MSFPILFEDEYFLAAEKPSGLPSQATVDKTRVDFFTELKKQVQTDLGINYLALHHRLDRDTSGVMIFAKTKEANEPLADLFKNHKVQKTYQCLTKATAKCPPQFTVENHLKEMRDAKTKKSKMVVTGSGGDRAVTQFRVLEKFADSFLMEAQPLTGRMHQIRVHLSGRGLGIYGDDIYPCPKTPQASRLMLHAHSLEFTHPFTGAFIKIESPLPQDIKEFQKLL